MNNELIPSQIYQIFENIKNQVGNISKYSGELRCKHFSIALRGRKVISPVLQNHYRTYVFGEKRGTIHAEMNSLNFLINSEKSYNGYNDHYSLKFGQYILCKKIFQKDG